MKIPYTHSLRQRFRVALGLLLTATSGCGSESNNGGTDAGGNGNLGGRGGSGGVGIINVGNGGAGVGGNTGTSPLAVWPPTGYINVTDTTQGAYALGPDISNGNVTAPGVCAGLFGVVRDFKMGSQSGGHPDFETAPSGDVQGIVMSTLGADGKPVYAHPSGTTAGTSGATNFDQWFHDTSGVNRTYMLGLKVVTVNGLSTFSASKDNGEGLADSSFFPLDGQGFGNEGEDHNFSFTTEIHTSFTYNGAEIFTFKGDDDVWVFINKQLVIDLGGRHGQETATVAVDTLGLTRGSVYDLAVFHAERHTSESNFQIQTTLAFTDCGQIGDVVIMQ